MNIESLHTAQKQLPSLLARALSGEEIVIADEQKHLVRLVPLVARPTQERKGGQWRGKATIADDFDALPEALLHVFKPSEPK